VDVVLVEPEIPQNTGNIARSCVATGSTLHLVEPLGFSLEDRYLKRAGMDYWRHLALEVHPCLDAFFDEVGKESCYFVSKKASLHYCEPRYAADSVLVFGCESRGLPEDLIAENRERSLRIPMMPGVRSLNLSNAVAVVLYEALRQVGFPGLQRRFERG
jgi:tRNA (cytidine/uridine-2'-O-)-methyltransferase